MYQCPPCEAANCKITRGGTASINLKVDYFFYFDAIESEIVRDINTDHDTYVQFNTM